MDETKVKAVFADVKKLLEAFGSKAEAVAYLAKETGISAEECGNAYDILMKLDAAQK